MRLFNALRPSRAERELAREVAAHQELIAEDLERRGLDNDEARRAAARRLGPILRVTEQHREARSFPMLDDARRDAWYALRMLRRSPGVSTIAIASLALGIGANTAAFSLIDSLIARRLSAPDAAQLVNVREVWPGARPRSEAPTWEYVGLRDGSTSVLTLAAIAVFDRSNVAFHTPAGAQLDAGRSRIAIVSGNYFPMIGIAPAIGRMLTPDDDRVRGEHRVAVLSHAYWRTRLAASPDVLGHTLTINQTTFSVIGVMPDGFAGDWVGRPVDVWVTTMMQGSVMIEAPDALIRPNDYWLRLVGRLKPGVSRAQAEAALQPVYQQVMREGAGPAAATPSLEVIARQRLELRDGAHGYSPERDSLSRFTVTVAAVAGLVLLAVGANVAGILLSRAAARQRELALRLAIGAGRARLGRQLLVEGALLSCLGGAGGVAIAMWGTQAMATALATAPVQMFWANSSWMSFDVEVSWKGLLFTAALSLIAGVICGLTPLARAGRLALASALSVRADHGLARSRFAMSKVLVIAQIALAIVIVVTAALLTRSLVGLRSQPLGFDRHNLALAWTQPSATGRQGQALHDLWNQATTRIAQVPGVTAVGAWNGSLLNGFVGTSGRAVEYLRVEGQPSRVSTLPGGRTFVTSGLFNALAIPILSGREFNERDTESSAPVVIINETMARFYFGNENPVGRRVTLGAQRGVEVVGVVRDFVLGSPRGVGQQRMDTYYPYRTSSGAQLVVMCVVIRTATDPRPIMPGIRDALRSIDPALAVLKINTIDEQLDDLLAQDRLLTATVGFFASVAALLSCLGLYGLVSHITRRRTSEIGIRMAMGATSTSILRMVLRDGGQLIALGVLAGILLSVAATRLIQAQLFAVGPQDPLTIGAAAMLMVAVAGAAVLLPARRAAKVDPMIALREG